MHTTEWWQYTRSLRGVRRAHPRDRSSSHRGPPHSPVSSLHSSLLLLPMALAARSEPLLTTCSIYNEPNRRALFTSRHESVVRGVASVLAEETIEGSGVYPGLGAPLDVERRMNAAAVCFHRVQGEGNPFAHLTIREPLSNELQDEGSSYLIRAVLPRYVRAPGWVSG